MYQCHLPLLCLELSFVAQLCIAPMGTLAESSKTRILIIPVGELRPFKKPSLAASRAGIRGLQYVFRDTVWPFMCVESVAGKAGWPCHNTGCTPRDY